MGHFWTRLVVDWSRKTRVCPLQLNWSCFCIRCRTKSKFWRQAMQWQWLWMAGEGAVELVLLGKSWSKWKPAAIPPSQSAASHSPGFCPTWLHVWESKVCEKHGEWSLVLVNNACLEEDSCVYSKIVLLFLSLNLRYWSRHLALWSPCRYSTVHV